MEQEKSMSLQEPIMLSLSDNHILLLTSVDKLFREDETFLTLLQEVIFTIPKKILQEIMDEDIKQQET